MKITKIELIIQPDFSKADAARKPKITAYVQCFTDTNTLVQLPLSESGILNILEAAGEDVREFCGSIGNSTSTALGRLYNRLDNQEPEDALP